jgi:hypothetical protein
MKNIPLSSSRHRYIYGNLQLRTHTILNKTSRGDVF